MALPFAPTSPACTTANYAVSQDAFERRKTDPGGSEDAAVEKLYSKKIHSRAHCIFYCDWNAGTAVRQSSQAIACRTCRGWTNLAKKSLMNFADWC